MEKQIVIKYGDAENMQIECDWTDQLKLVQVLAPTLGAVMQTVFAGDKEVLYKSIIETQNIFKIFKISANQMLNVVLAKNFGIRTFAFDENNI